MLGIVLLILALLGLVGVLVYAAVKLAFAVLEFILVSIEEHGFGRLVRNVLLLCYGDRCCVWWRDELHHQL